MPPPPRHPLGLAPDFVGPEGHREDVSGWSDRQVVVRALDVALHTREDLRVIKLGLRLELDDHAHRLTALDGQLPQRPPPIVPDSYRDPDASQHDWSADLAKADRILRQAVRDPQRPEMTSDRARAIAAEVLQAAEQGKELSTWRRVKDLRWKAVEALVTLAVGGAVAELIRLWAAHH